MTRRNITDLIKNAVGTVFLLAGAFFVCSTLVSMRAVFADPIAPTVTATATSASPRATTATARAGASRTTTATARPTTTASRATTARPSVANGTINTATTTSRGVASRGNTARTATARPTTTTGATSRAATSTASRATATRTGNAASRTGATTTSRGVTARTGATTARVAANNTGRTVAARSGTAAGASRVSLQGTAIRGSSTSNTYTYLQNKLYTGNYSNIIDSTTGLISADAYNNCMESYYACMDEICTARNAAQRRCACAGRVKAFADAESKLETANEELIKVSGELALLVATKGKDISAALQLTDAEKVMNCVSWQEMSEKYKASKNSDDVTTWCQNHGFYDTSKCSASKSPDYCTNNDFGFNIANIEGGSSDILASLQSWATAKENTLTMLNNSDTNLSNAFENLNTIVNNLAGTNGSLTLNATTSATDALAATWGYDLFQYAHNNVCNRVLDSCFNGIYEACGTPPSGSFTNGQRKCGNGASQCPFNYSSYVNVKTDSTTGGDLDFITSTTSSGSVSNSATCFGYTSASGDPYNNLRGPVADARRSIMQKYALDANADCDVYGEQLRTQAQNIGYQKVAAQQALQQKRLEFAMEEDEANETALANAKQNYLQCLDEIYQCRIDVQRQYASQGWTTTRIKSYCNTMSNVPSCYEQMICDQGATNVITAEDVANNKSNSTIAQNVVSLTDILTLKDDGTDNRPADARATCLANDMNVQEIRSFGTYAQDQETCIPTNGVKGYKNWNSTTNGWGDCIATECKVGFIINNGKCELPANSTLDQTATVVGPFVPVPGVRCNSDYIASGTQCVLANCAAKGNASYTQQCTGTDNNGVIGGCVSTGCKCINNAVNHNGTCIACGANEHYDNGKCVSNSTTCTMENAEAATQTWNTTANTWNNDCHPTKCKAGYEIKDNKCVAIETDDTASE